MRILVLSSSVPYPPYGGGRARVMAILRHLSREHRVHLLALASPAEMVHRSALEEICRDVTLLPSPPPRRGLPRWLHGLQQLALLQAYDTHPAIWTAVQKAAVDCDLIQVENVYMTPYAAAAAGTPKILDIFGLWNAGVRRDLALAPGWSARARILSQWLRAKRAERALSRQFDAVCVVSEDDRRYLAAIDPRLKIYVVPNGVDTDHLTPAPELPGPPIHLVFTGAMDYAVNEDAVLFFHRRIYPDLCERLPDLRFWIVGRDPGPRLAALAADPRITVTGAVDDIRPYLAQATVVVVPMRLGSGTRIKVLEALAMGKAIVTTSTGVDGLPVVSGRHAVIVDDPGEFSAAIVRLAESPATRGRLGAEGRAFVDGCYDWPTVLAGMDRAVHEVAGRGRGPWAR